MAICEWCNNEMTTGASCTVSTLHLRGARIAIAPYRPSRRTASRRCGDCGVAPGGFHHPGCDLQRCPRCAGQFISCGCRFDEDLFGGDDDYDHYDDDDDFGDDWSELLEPFGIDADGNPMGRFLAGRHEVIVHFADLPESDRTVVRGIPCTTAVRTLIDCAPYSSPEHIRKMVDDAVARGLFTLDELWHRLGQPDMQDRPSAELVRRAVPPLG